MTKLLTTLLPFAALLLGLSACTQEEAIGGGENTPAILRITPAGIGKTGTRAGTATQEAGTDAERTASILHIYYFKQPGDIFIKRQSYAPPGDTYNYLLNVPADVVNQGSVSLRVFASPGIDMPEEADAPTIAQLEALHAPGMTDGTTNLVYTDTKYIPMNCAGTITNDFAVTKAISIPVTRTAAKLRIGVVPGRVTGIDVHTDRMTLQLLNLRSRTPFYLPADGLTPDAIATFDSQKFDAAAAAGSTALVPETTLAADGTTATWQHTAYINEHIFDTAPGVPLPDTRAQLQLNLPYTVNVGTADEEEVTINRYTLPLDFPVVRNHIYQLTVNINGSGEGPRPVEVTLNIEILPWEHITANPIE